MRSITNCDPRKLTALIGQASKRVVYAAPGASAEVAEALCSAWKRLGGDAVTVILDADPEVCRFGYGDLEGLKRLQGAARTFGTIVSEQRGLRIGLVVTDDHFLVYSPTPLLLEGGSDAPEHPNAIALGTLPANVATELGMGPGGIADRVVGLDPIRPDRIDDVERDLAKAPPLKFDLARRVRVFTSRFQFVELEMTGCFVSRRRIRIPSALIGLGRTPDVERQLSAHFNLVEKGELEVTRDKQVISEGWLQGKRREIEDNYLVVLPGYGTVLLRANKQRFEEAVEALRQDVHAFAIGVAQQLRQRIDANRTALVEALLPAVERAPPAAYTRTQGPSPDRAALRQRLEKDIGEAFGTAEALIREMKVRVVFKDVAYESLVDEKFIGVARSAMPELEFLHEEFDAAAGEEEA